MGLVESALLRVKLAGGFTHFYLKDMSKLASWPDFAEACTERVDAASIWGDTMVRCVEKEFHEVGTAMPSFLLAVVMEISKDCAMEMTSVWLHDRSS